MTQNIAIPAQASLGAVYENITALFEAADLDTPKLDARILLCHACDVTHEQFIMYPDNRVVNEDRARLTDYIHRRLDGEPVSKIIGYRDFWKDRFRIGLETLDPRPDTEILIEHILDHITEHKNVNAALRILDLGTGSGCILLSLLGELENALGFGADISMQALEIAHSNARILGLSERAQFIKSHWLECFCGDYDIIVSNPPYIPCRVIKSLMAEVKDYDPHIALDGGEDGLQSYRHIVEQIANLSNSKEGFLVFEVGLGQARAVRTILENHISQKYHSVKYQYDLNGYVRCVSAHFRQ
ncbi:MAG: peptide chain release factor N(5)-glutamine methyltransferase [Pseudomonadota bacterium]